MKRTTPAPFELLGARVKDRVTGLVGIVTGIASWQTGCDSVCMTAEKVSEKGEVIASSWTDVSRIEVIASDDQVADEKGLTLEYQFEPPAPSSPRLAARGAPHDEPTSPSRG